jgi:hypothetical protein
MDKLIQPVDFVYIGAFRLPDGPAEIGWEWSGASLAYHPRGDPAGGDDDFPGSLFGTGHNWNQFVSEISIPIPVYSPEKDPDQLNQAATLQEFNNVRADLFQHLDFEIPRAGLAYLPPQGEQTSGKLHFCWGQHLQEEENQPTHGWSELDLADSWLDDSDLFEDWVLAKRETTRRQALDALEALATASLRGGTYQKAEAYARRQLEIDDHPVVAAKHPSLFPCASYVYSTLAIIVAAAERKTCWEDQ